MAKIVNTHFGKKKKNHYIGKVNYLCEIHYILNRRIISTTNGRKPTAREASKGGQSKV